MDKASLTRDKELWMIDPPFKSWTSAIRKEREKRIAYEKLIKCEVCGKPVNYLYTGRYLHTTCVDTVEDS
jgi:hypothetical protein